MTGGVSNPYRGKSSWWGIPNNPSTGFAVQTSRPIWRWSANTIQARDGIECRLTTNFRSQAGIINVVNGAFENLIRQSAGLQPGYIAIEPGNDNDSTVAATPVVLRRGSPSQEPLNAKAARDREAESLAHWLATEVLGRSIVPGKDGQTTPARPGHVAFLMRSLRHVQAYLEPLRRLGIGYVVEGERNFYATQEVIDAVNLLRTIDNPHDRLALVGVLRSPLGAQNDRQLFELSHANLLDYRLMGSPRWVDVPNTVAGLYHTLLGLHRETRRMTVGRAVQLSFRELPLRLLAASGFSGEQAVANLE